MITILNALAQSIHGYEWMPRPIPVRPSLQKKLYCKQNANLFITTPLPAVDQNFRLNNVVRMCIMTRELEKLYMYHVNTSDVMFISFHCFILVNAPSSSPDCPLQCEKCGDGYYLPPVSSRPRWRKVGPGLELLCAVSPYHQHPLHPHRLYIPLG